MRIWELWRAGFLAAALLAAPAFAQDEVVVIEEDDGVGFDDTRLTARGGLSSFTGDIGDATDPGAFIGIQADAMPVNGVGVELGYEGSRNVLSGDDNGALWRHNVGALAKMGPIIQDFRPFVGVGFGVSYLNASDEAAGIIADSDVITEVPLAAGLEYRVGEVVAGARATYRFLGDEELGFGVDEGNLFTAGITLGGRF